MNDEVYDPVFELNPETADDPHAEAHALSEHLGAPWTVIHDEKARALYLARRGE